MSARAQLSSARFVAVKRMPYFARGILGMPVAEIKMDFARAVTKAGVLCVDLSKWEGETPLFSAAGILHEYMHLYFRHAVRFERLVKSGGATVDQHMLWNLAADLEINDGLLEAGLPMECNGKERPTPQHYGFDTGLSAEHYFVLLQKQDRDHGSSCGCGSGSGGELIPGEPSGGRSQLDIEVQASIDAGEVAAYAKAKGNVPGNIMRQADLIKGGAKVSWDRELAIVARRCVAHLPGLDDYSYQVPARFDMTSPCGAIPKIPGMRRATAEVAMVWDTSGSMSIEDIQAVSQQAKRILDQLPGCAITLLACDAAVHSVAKVRSPNEFGRHLKGGGGTSFVPAFDAVARLRPRPDLIVFGTDGYGCYPEIKPSTPVIWLVTPGGHIDVPWGKRIQLPESTGD